MSLLGIDVGTSGCKAAVFSEEGQLLEIAYDEYDFQRPQPGWAELDSLQVWQKIKDAIRKAARGARHDPIKALSVSSLGESVVPVTNERQILGPSLLNFDVRGAEYLPELRLVIDDERLYQLNGNALGNQFTLTKLLWMKDHQPDLYRQADWLLHWSGFVAFMLGAEPAVDYSLANRTLLFDLARRDWSDELLGLTHLNRTCLPPAVPSGAIIGYVSGEMASELGLPAGIPIVNGGHDQSCNGVGCGVIEAGRAMYGMGTYICVMPVFDQRPAPAAMLERGLSTEHHTVAGQFISFVYNQGGVLVKWFRDTFALAERERARTTGEDLYAALIAEMPPEPSRVMVLPHFTITGPPHFIQDSCGVMAGMRLETARGEILKAIIEATTFYLRECMDSPAGQSATESPIQIADFRAVGGGSKSEAWIQICADILGKPFVRPRITEAGVLGAAILAGAGSGIFPSIQAGVERMVKLEHEFYPNPQMQARYDERFELYRRLYPPMKDLLHDLSAG